MKKKYILLSIFIILVVFSLAIKYWDVRIYGIVWNNNPVINIFKIKKTEYTSDSYDLKFKSTVITGKNDGIILKFKKIENISRIYANNYVDNKIAVITTLYKGFYSANPGIISNRVECDNINFYLERVKNEPYDYFKILATSRLTYGACTLDLIEYRSLLYFMYCENQSEFFQFELFSPLNRSQSTIENKLKEISCNTFYPNKEPKQGIVSYVDIGLPGELLQDFEVTENTFVEEKINKLNIGTVKYDKSKAFDGYNLYENILMDMEGNLVKSWTKFDYVIILNDGNILGVTNYTIVGKYDMDSNVIWEKSIESDHEWIESSEGTLLIASYEMHEYNGIDNIVFDVILELSQEDGQEISRWSTYENLDYLKKFHLPLKLDLPNFFLDLPIFFSNLSFYEQRWAFRIYHHLNSIQALPQNPLGEKDTRFQKGNLLVSFRTMDLIMILDKDTKEIVWSWGVGDLQQQHMPRMLDDGNILIYDNGFNYRKYTRIIELNPVRKEIVWEYVANPKNSFYSPEQGSAQRLPNGNTLIAESFKGRAFEVTMDGEIVWEWFNPKISEDSINSVFYRITRLPKDQIDKFLGTNVP